MGRRVLAGLVAAAFLALTLPACGSAEETSSSERSTTVAKASKKKRGGVALKRIGNFDSPVYVAGAPGYPDLVFVVEQSGKVIALRGGRRLGRPFLDISGLVSFEGERGLLSIAFAPDYKAGKSFYVYYTDAKGNIQIDEYKRRSPTRAAAGSRRAVIQVPHTVNSNHNGGQLQFLGDLLYIGTGDGGSGGDPPNNAQNKESLLGKLLRIDPRASGGAPYGAPASNPFVGRPGRDEIYSYGLRNPFRFSFDTTSAPQPRIAIGDVGQNAIEEIDYTTVAAASGANFGWDAFEGFAPYEDENSGTADPGNTTKPIFAYGHSRGGSCTVIGGYVVDDPALPSLRGRYVYADYCEGQLRSLVPHLNRASGERRLGLAVEAPTSFGTDTRGHIYVTSQAGPVYRLVQR